jgi:hypothetical protein
MRADPMACPCVMLAPRVKHTSLTINQASCRAVCDFSAAGRRSKGLRCAFEVQELHMIRVPARQLGLHAYVVKG